MLEWDKHRMATQTMLSYLQYIAHHSICSLHVPLSCFATEIELSVMSDVVQTSSDPCAGNLDGPLAGLKDLEVLILLNASLQGTLPVEWPEQLPQLQFLQLNNNHLTGMRYWDTPDTATSPQRQCC